MIKPSVSHTAARGMSLLELIIGLTVLSLAFLLLIGILHVFASGMKVETVNSDQNTRVRGTLYDIGSELRQATASSPHFFIEQVPSKEPSITFDLIDSVNAEGAYVWGNQITYKLVAAPSLDTTILATSGITRAQLVREELTKSGETISSVIEDNVPLKFSNKGIVTWGFTVSRNDSALAISLSRFGDTGVNTPDAVNPLAPSGGSNHSVIVSTANTVYYLRNPQAVQVLQ